MEWTINLWRAIQNGRLLLLHKFFNLPIIKIDDVPIYHIFIYGIQVYFLCKCAKSGGKCTQHHHRNLLVKMSETEMKTCSGRKYLFLFCNCPVSAVLS